jgi:SpoVK/Ycf46/Vps4 family AAA+-type ATPase
LTAATLGLHLVEINAHSLLEVSEQETLDNVRQAIRFAQQNAPCILHIRRFEALKSIASAKQQADVQSLGRDIATLMRNSKEMVLLVASCTSGSLPFLPSFINSLSRFSQIFIVLIQLVMSAQVFDPYSLTSLCCRLQIVPNANSCWRIDFARRTLIINQCSLKI